MGWTNKNQKRYFTKLWYCESCEKRTQVELNPAWMYEGMPFTWEEPKCPWDWFSRCKTCGTEHWDSSNYDCPNCGCPSEPAEASENEDGELEWSSATFIKSENWNRISSTIDHPSGMEWDEQHRCSKCKTKFWYSNSSL